MLPALRSTLLVVPYATRCIVLALGLCAASAAAQAPAPAAPPPVLNGCTLAPGTSCPNADFTGLGQTKPLPIRDGPLDLRGADFRGAKFDHTMFLGNANPDGANLAGASFVSAGMQRATVNNANFTGAKGGIDADMSASLFFRAAFRGVHINGRAYGADFTNANLAGAIVGSSQVYFANTDFTGANF